MYTKEHKQENHILVRLPMSKEINLSNKHITKELYIPLMNISDMLWQCRNTDYWTN